MEPTPPLKRIAVIAHRGGAGLAAENTLAAIRNAIEVGADFVEIDVRCTRDGGLVLMHDRSVDRTTNGTGAVGELNCETIRILDAGSKFGPEYAGEPVATLTEALQACRDKIRIYLDHKDGPVETISEAIDAEEMRSGVLVYSRVETLWEWKRVAPGIRVMPTLPVPFRHPGGISEFLGAFPADVLDGAIGDWNAHLVEEAHAAGRQVYVDCLGDDDAEALYRNAVAFGVDGIQTDRPDNVLRFLERTA